MPTWRIWPVLLLALALQTTWLAHWTPLGVHVDLPLLTAVSVALLLGWRAGASYGLAAGLLTGYCAGIDIGSFALSRLAMGAALGLFEKRFSRDNLLAPPLCAVGGVLLSDFMFILMAPTAFPLAWWARHAAASALLHAVLIWPVHALIARFVLPPSRLMFA